MIKSRKELKYYLQQDRLALGIPESKGILQKLKSWLFPNEIWKFERLLRHVEYYSNKGIGGAFFHMFYRYRFHRHSVRLGFTIPVNVCAEGLSIAHYGNIVISQNARIGKNCRIHTGVNIGASGGNNEAPQIGDNVYIGPGAIVFGNIHIANNVTIGANATVNKSCDTENCVLAGSPAVIVKENSANWLDFNKVLK
jgi:serine O-acetyltransferase